MNSLKRLITVIVVCLATKITAYGCICVPFSVENYLYRNDTLPKNQHVVVFKGKVVTEAIDSIFNVYGLGEVVNIKILEYWQDDELGFLEGDIISVFNDGSDCAIHFQKDSTYLIRAVRQGLYFATSQCEGTVLVSDLSAQNDLRFLGKGKVQTLRSSKSHYG